MKIALFGNPNTGKSSVFNMLTGLRQQVGNFPGVTVDKKKGSIQTPSGTHELIDFPGTYSIFARSLDEQVVREVLNQPQHQDYPDTIIYVADASNLERNLLFFSQLYDLGYPIVLVLNMWDRAQQKGIKINLAALEQAFPGAAVVTSNARISLGKNRILEALETLNKIKRAPFFDHDFDSLQSNVAQKANADGRLQKIRSLGLTEINETASPNQSTRLDQILTHRIFGYLIFSLVLLVIFQFIFSFASIPMDFIDQQFVRFSDWSAQMLPEGLFSKLITQGLIPGLGGVLVFVPQIAILFFFIALLEESGYLSRVVFIMDRLMRPFGLNGKSATTFQCRLRYSRHYVCTHHCRLERTPHYHFGCAIYELLRAHSSIHLTDQFGYSQNLHRGHFQFTRVGSFWIICTRYHFCARHSHHLKVARQEWHSGLSCNGTTRLQNAALSKCWVYRF
jgi:ferrous iron transport protein B